MTTDMVHLRRDGTSVVLALDECLPAIACWGPDLGELDAEDMARLADLLVGLPAVTQMDTPIPITVLPEARQGWTGPSGLSAHRAGRNPYSAFTEATHAVTEWALETTATDPGASTGIRLRLELLPGGALRTRATLTNHGEDNLELVGCDLAMPVPARLDTLLDFTGTQCGERHPQYSRLVDGTHLRENVRGRPGQDAATALFVGTGELERGLGETWGVHLGWSGNSRLWAHRSSSGRLHLGGGELLAAGEMRLAPGASYTSPWLYLSHGDGLDEATGRWHDHLRARPGHPGLDRPVTLNTWEAVYFEQDVDALQELAQRAAAVGVERFVLDDGWFRGRRNSRRGLGDWEVDETVWPQGLAPLADYARGLGMQFGLWFESEMVNPDSELARTHPEWLLAPPGRDVVLSRNQAVLNLAEPGAYAHVRDQMIHLVRELRLDFIKWDHNRDLIEPVDRRTGRSGVHAQTTAAYRLMNDVRFARPGLEIESCSSGGGRIDLGVIEHVDRFWASDSLDPVERQRIQRWTTLLVPPELMGAHVGAPQSHTTGRVSSLALRAITAMVGSFGIEWDLRTAGPEELQELAKWTARYRRFRPLIGCGRLHRCLTEPALIAQLVIDPEREHGMGTLAAVDTPRLLEAMPWRMRGLDPQRRYRVTALPAPGLDPISARRQPAWWSEGAIASGQVLESIGLPMPHLRAMEATMIEIGPA